MFYYHLHPDNMLPIVFKDFYFFVMLLWVPARIDGCNRCSDVPNGQREVFQGLHEAQVRPPLNINFEQI